MNSSNPTNYYINNTEDNLFPKSKSKNKCLKNTLIVGAIILVLGIIAIVIGVALTKKNKNSYKPPAIFPEDEDSQSTDEVEKTPIEVNISYNKNELKFFNIEKNISSIIIGENNKTTQNSTFYYNCVLGIKNKIEENNSKFYYEGFFAILNTIYFNKTNYQKKLMRNNIILKNIINNDTNNLRNLQKNYDYHNEYDSEEEEKKKKKKKK